MTVIWLDAHLSPSLARWIREELGLDARSLDQLGLRHATDSRIFREAAAEGAVILTKDRDFALLATSSRTPAHVIWLRCGNASTARIRLILASGLTAAVESIEHGARLIEIAE